MAAIYKNFNTNNGTELERIFNFGFKDCALYISKMDTMKKAEVAAEIQPILDALYMQAGRYGNSNYSRDEQISPEIFIHVMSQIKRWETILYWLYEIDILMEETELDKQVRIAEKKMESIGWDINKTHLKVTPNVNNIVSPKSGKITKNLVTSSTYAEEYNALMDKKETRVNHTDEIMDTAKALASKFFGGK